MRKASLIALGLAAVLCLDLWVHGATAAQFLAHIHAHPPHALEHSFWDAQPYATGIADQRAGRSPYHSDDLANPLPFVYPPAFVWTGAALAQLFPSPWGWRLYILIYLASVFGVQMLLGTLYLSKPTGLEWLAAFFLLPLAPFLSTAFLSGNIHAVWYFAALLAAIPGIRHGQWTWFYLVTLLAAINQPVFTIFLLFPLFAGIRQYLPAFRTALAIGAAYSLEWYSNPTMNLRFQESVAAHLAVSRDFGEGIFGICTHAGTGLILPLALQILFSGAVIASLVWLKRRGVANDRCWWALLILAIILVNPRIMPYDAALGFAPGIFFLVYDQRRGWLLTLPAVAVCIVFHSTVGFTPLILAGFLSGAITLAHSTVAQSSPRSQSLSFA